MENENENNDKVMRPIDFYIPKETQEDFLFCLSKLEAGEYTHVINLMNCFIDSRVVGALWPYYLRGMAQWESGNLEEGLKDFMFISSQRIDPKNDEWGVQANFLSGRLCAFPCLTGAFSGIRDRLKED
jgi:hypothetical protein